MSQLIFHDMLDTVRTLDFNRDETEFSARRFAAANLMLSVMLGDTPVLSQTHAFDSSAVLGTLQNPEDAFALLSLIRRGFLRVKLFRKPDLIAAFLAAIDNDNFIFSGWPELQKGEIDRAAVRARTVEGGISNLPETVLARIASLKDLSAAISEAIDKDEAVPSPVQLDTIINRAVKVVPIEYTHNVLKLHELHSTDRSVHYKAIGAMPISQHDKNILRSIVDMAYNKVIATSLGATHITLTGSEPKAVACVTELLSEEVRTREPFSTEEIVGLHRLGWSEIEQFTTAHQAYDRRDRIREGFEAKFLARVHAPGLGVAILPKFASLFFGGSVGAATALFGALYPDPLTVAVGGFIGALLSAISVAPKAEELVLNRVTAKYAGILERKRI